MNTFTTNNNPTPNTTNSINNTNENCVILERHYIPYHLYREMYNYPRHQNMFNNNYYDNNQNNSLFTNSNPMNYRYNLFNSMPNSNTMNMNTNMMNTNNEPNNEPNNIRRPIIPSLFPYPFHTEPQLPINRNHLYTIPTQTTHSTSNNNVFRNNFTSNLPFNHNLNINNILNDVINDMSDSSDIPNIQNIPYNFEINDGF